MKSTYILLLILTTLPNNAANIILAGKGSWGRLGDNILLYCKAKYFSYKHKIPLERRNFPFFEGLALAGYEKLHTNRTDALYSKKILVRDKRDLQPRGGTSILFEIDYFCNMRKKENNEGSYVGCGEFPFDWIKKKMMKYPDFGEELRRNLQVKDYCAQSIPTCKDGFTVAVATRMGSGRDLGLTSEQFFSIDQNNLYENKLPVGAASKSYDVLFPFKFVPQQFYIDQVKRLSELLHHYPLHIYFFIDKDRAFTEEILQHWYAALADYKNITIECHVEKKQEGRIFDDLALIGMCDFLIRGCSHFAGIAQLAGQHRIIMGPDPVSAGWLDGKYLVFKKTFIYFQNVKEYKFEQYVFEDTEKNRLQKMVELYCNINNL